MSDIDVVGEFSETPLFIATWFRRSNNMSLLLSHGADPTVVDAAGESLLHLAARLGFQDNSLILAADGCDLTILNSIGPTLELLARKFGHDILADELRFRDYEQGGSVKFSLICVSDREGTS